MVRAFRHMVRTPLGFLAALSVAALVAVSAWKVVSLLSADAGVQPIAMTDTTPSVETDAAFEQELLLYGLQDEADPTATSSEDSVAMITPMVFAQLIGQYSALRENGDFSAAAVTRVTDSIARNVKAAVFYEPYELADLHTDLDTSYERMLQYRADLRVSTAPLLENTENEFEVFGRFVETADPAQLEKLRVAAGKYREAAALTAAVVVPRDAVNYHLDILNAMAQFAATLEALASHGGDPLASAAILRTYNEAESDMLFSFNALSKYYGQKTP